MANDYTAAPQWIPTYGLLMAVLAVYILALIVIWLRTRRASDAALPFTLARGSALALVAVGLGLHSLELYWKLSNNQGIVLALEVSFLLVTWMAMLLYGLAALFRPILNLGIVVLPISIAGVLAAFFQRSSASSGAAMPIEAPHLHLLIGVLTFGILCLAFAQAVLVMLQERQLRVPHGQETKGFFFPSLPPLQSMETLLFELLVLGFALLSVNLVVGLMFARDTLGTALPFTHHALLNLIAWVGFGALIAGHYLWGWRGQRAARYTMIGFGVFFLGYFGPQVVRDWLLSGG